jgi:holin-like protein
MLDALLVLFVCQLAGEAVAATTGLPVPGPVIGMVILLAGLLRLGRVPRPLARTTDTIAANLSLLFVPAGVGVMLHADLVGRDAWPLALAVFVSTALAIAVTGVLMQRLARRGDRAGS